MDSIPDYKDLFKTMDLGVVYQDNSGKIIHFNPAAEAILGLSKDRLLHLDSNSKVWQALKEDGSPFPGEEHPAMIALKTGKRIQNVVMGIYHEQSGQDRWIKINAIPEYDDEDKDKPCRVFTTFYDITDQVIAEKELKKSKYQIEQNIKQLEAIVDALPGMVSVVDKEFNIIIANNEVIRVFGQSNKEEVIGKKCYALRKKLDTICPQCAIKQAYETGVTITRLSTPEEDQLMGISTQSYAVPITFENGEIWGGVEAIIDISERKQAEEKLRKHFYEYQELNKIYMAQNEELIGTLQRIQHINRELEEAKRSAEESDRLKTAFLANMSHEIRTPMNGILGFAALLAENKLSGRERNKYIEIIQHSSNRMLSIINDLIDISRIESGQMEVKISMVNLNDVIDNLFDFFIQPAKKKGLSLSFEKGLPDADSNFQTDETKLCQVFTNLIKNALKYTREGEILFGYSLKEKQIEFYVKDTGIGIASGMHEVIFDRFRQGDHSDKMGYEGSGLGLSISKAFVEMLGGRIWLNSEPGKGSTFYFSLPAVKPSINVSKSPVKEKQIELPLKGKKILVAEDDRTSIILLREILRRAGAAIVHAANGKLAVDIVKSSTDIDLILMDIRMPQLNGAEALKQIKKLKPGLPVIVQTAYALCTDKQKYFDLGCDDYISKPLDRKLLIEKITRLIQAKHTTKAIKA
jgi:PAS domain S-box-containing protein